LGFGNAAETRSVGAIWRFSLSAIHSLFRKRREKPIIDFMCTTARLLMQQPKPKGSS
jgi:hypothetical protein